MRNKRFCFRLLITGLLALSILVISPINTMARPISEIQKEQEKLKKELSALNTQFVELLSQIQSLETQIAENQAAIEETELNLIEAQAAEQKQFHDMQLRMQYMYENSDTSMFEMLLLSKNFSDFLNKIEYANAVYEYDRQLLDSYEAIRMEIEGIQADLEAQRTSLASQQEQLSAAKVSLNGLIESKKGEVADIDKELAKAKEEAAKRAAALAAQREAQRVQANASSANASINNSTVGGGNPAPSTGVSGGSVVAYANQFVGNPYVWGGNSLTNGCDCSGFVVQVYKNFGINLSGSRNSAALRSVGQAVSYENMQAGDIICYSGHVAIYNGNGTIVEAQNQRNGITSSRSVNCKQILAIRRVI